MAERAGAVTAPGCGGGSACRGTTGRGRGAARTNLRAGPAGWLAVALWSCVAAGPPAAASTAGDYQPAATFGALPGNGDNGDVDIGFLGLEVTHYFREGLGFVSQAGLLRPRGRRDGRSADTGAAAATFGLRWHVHRGHGHSLFLEWGSGGLLALHPFPPGGTRLNAASHFGAGIDVALPRGLGLRAGIRQMHVSNGKGMVAENPSFDGLGGYAGVALRPAYKRPYPPVSASTPFGGPPWRWRIDATYGRVDDHGSPGATAALDLPLSRSGRVRVELFGRAARLVGELDQEVGLHLYHESARRRIIAGYARQDFSVFVSHYLIGQLEEALNDASTAVALAALENKNLSDDRVFGGIFLTTYPAAFAAVTTGIGFERQEHEYFSHFDNLNDAGFHVSAEAAPPSLARLGLSVYANVGVGYDTQAVGLRWLPGESGSVRDRHRRGGVVVRR